MPEKYAVESDDFRLDGVVKPDGTTAEREPATSPQRRAVADSGDPPGRRSWRINYWLLAGTLLVVVVAGPTLYLWRNFQVQRNADALVHRAEDLAEKEDWRGAADFYHRYLQLVPGDSQVVVARALAFDKTAESPDRVNRAVALLFQAVDADPADVELRMRLAQRLYEQQRWVVAREQLAIILDASPDHLEAARLSALALRSQLGPSRIVTVGDVAETHEAMLVKHPGDPVLSISLATVYRENLNSIPDRSPEQVADLADAVMDRMVAENPDDAEAYLARFRYRRLHDLEGADEDLARALAIAPDSPNVMFAAASEFRRDDLGRSRQFALRLMETEPKDHRGYQISAEIQSQMGDIDGAIASLRAGLEAIGSEDYVLKRTLLSVALDSGRLELAQQTLKELNTWLQRVSPYLPTIDRRRLDEDLQLAEARRLMIGGQAAAAVPTLKRLALLVSEGSDAEENLRQRVRRWQMLSEAYSQLQQWDLAADAMREASRIRPSDYRNLLAEADLARRGGDLPSAVQLVQEAAVKPGAPPALWLSLAELLIESEFQRSGDQPRDWRRVRAALERARPTLRGTPAFVSLQARWALADGRRDDALTELQAILPVEQVPLESAGELALLFAASGDPATAEALTERLLAEEQFVGQGELTMVQLMARRGDYDGARVQLEQIATAGREAEKQDLLARLIALEVEGGFVGDARRRLARLRDENLASVPILDLGASLSIQAKDWDELAKYREALERLEGPSGTVWRFYSALTSLERDVDRQNMGLAIARDLLKDLEQLRPLWLSNLIIKGRLAERQGNPDEALVHYQEAARRGARSILLIDWLIAGLYRQNRFEEAVAYLRQVGPAAGISTQASGLALPAYVSEGRIEDALRMARMSAELHAGEALPQMLYGQVLAVSGDLEQAEKQFRRAIELAPRDPRTWGGLIWFLAQSQQGDQLRETIGQLTETTTLPPIERELLAARGLAMMGDRPQATLRYQAALNSRPDDPLILEEVARFYMQSNLERALELYRRLLAVAPQSAVARRSIALILGMRGTDEGVSEALELLKSGDPATTPESAQVAERLGAVLLMRGNESQRAEAVERLGRLLEGQQEPAPIDRLLMARALELAGRPDEAQQVYQDLLDSNVTADSASMFAAFLSRQKRYADLEKVLDQLEKLDSTGANTLMLRAELLSGTDRHEAIDPLVTKYVADRRQAGRDERQRVVRLANAVLRQHGRWEALEKILREYATPEGDGGDMLIGFLLDQQRMEEALKLAVEFGDQDVQQRTPLALLQVLTVLTARKAPHSHLLEEAEAILEKALSIHQKDVRFLFDLGTLRVMQGRNEEAIALYEASLAIQPEYLPAMNNLSIMLASIPERREEALRMAEQLMDRAPDSAEVKDSYALVLLGCEQYADAQEVLATLVEANPNNPRYWFHYAIAKERLGNSPAAKEAFHAALAHGLEKEFLTPAEDEHVAELTRRHGSAAVSEENTVSEGD